jgi:3-oxoacyl-[acyl-carrier-protein] synthase-3
MTQSFRSRIVGSGHFAPPRVVSNDDLAALVDTNDEWIRTRTGIKTRRLIDHEGHMGTVDMAEPAARDALEMAGLKAEDLDMIIVGTVTPDLRLPSAACLLQNRLGATRANAFDVLAACAGSLFAIGVADQFIKTGAAKNILVIGGETLTAITNWSDRNTCVLFGDAAGALVLQASDPDGPGLIESKLYSDGRHWKDIHIPAGGSKTPLTAALLDEKADRMVMNGRKVFKFAVNALVDASKSALERNGLKPDDIGQVVAHQANMRIIEAVADRVGIPMDRFSIVIDRYGNTSSASPLIAYNEARAEGKIKEGAYILMMAIGSGFAWSTALFKA